MKKSFKHNRRTSTENIQIEANKTAFSFFDAWNFIIPAIKLSMSLQTLLLKASSPKTLPLVVSWPLEYIENRPHHQFLYPTSL